MKSRRNLLQDGELILYSKHKLLSCLCLKRNDFKDWGDNVKLKHLPTILIAVAIVVVLILSANKGPQHGNLQDWINFKHASVVKNNRDPVGQCYKCHGKQTSKKIKGREDFCNRCHKARGIRLMPKTGTI